MLVAEPWRFSGHGHGQRHTGTHMDTDRHMDNDTDLDMNNIYWHPKVCAMSLQHLTNGATESLAQNTWFYQSAIINKVVRREILYILLISVAPDICCFRLCSTILIGADIIEKQAECYSHVNCSTI